MPSHYRTAIRAALAIALVAVAPGCQVQTVSSVRLQQHQQVLDLIGLMPVQARERLRVSVAPPLHWRALVPTEGFCYLHQQWRSPRRNAGMGVVYIQSPLPISTRALLWLATLQYARTYPNGDGHIVSQWTDKLGRNWFIAEDHTFHLRGYLMSQGNEAWIVYSGYRIAQKPPARDIALADRAADSVAVLPK